MLGALPLRATALLVITASASARTNKPLTKNLCEDVFDNHVDGAEMADMHVPFGDIWSKYLGPKVFCPDLGSRKEAIAQVTQEGCNINWREGKFDKKDASFSKAGAHTGQAMGPAVLGFDNDLDAYCKLEDPEGLEESRADASCGKHNRLYLKEWTLCKNMKWILCAGMGFLPGQNGVGEIIMVTPVRKMDGGRMAKPEDVPEGTPPLSDEERKDYEDEKHRVPEAFGVTVHEVCTLNRMCSNGDAVFGVAEGATFVCEDPSIPMDLLVDAGAQILPDTAEDGNVPEELDMPNFRRAMSTSKLRGNALMGTLEHIDQILVKELDVLKGEQDKAE